MGQKYICIRQCFHNGILYDIGRIEFFENGEYPKDKEGKLCHFNLIEEPKPIEEKIPKEEPMPEIENSEPERRGPGRPAKK